MDPRAAAERVRAASVAGFRHRGEAVAGGEVLEIDGLVLSLTNLPDASLNATCVAAEPSDPDRALADAEAAFRARGMPWFGLEIERDAHPEVERAARAAGLALLFTRPALAVAVSELRIPPEPAGIAIEPVEDLEGLHGLRAVEVEAFGTAPEVAEGLVGPALLERDDARLWRARDGELTVGEAAGLLLGDTVGVFGVGVLEASRGRGIGAALTAAAVRSFPDADLAWLLPSELAEPLYRRLGFVTVSEWEVWIRPPT
jgi:ribosomal protein S18 acetylase RimI-like enzyme